MAINIIDRLGELNPQVFRELKGRVNLRNMAIASAITVLSQLVLVFSFLGQLPHQDTIQNRYCTGAKPEYYYQQLHCLKDPFGQPIVNWQLWWTDVFVWLSIIGIFVSLVAGIYILVSDLDREERRGTLNFIRLSPQSTYSILLGKLFSVPILLYYGIGLALPLQIWSGLSAGIPGSYILGFDTVILGSCAFFYSAAILFGLVSSWMGGFQAWLGSGAVFLLGLFSSTVRIDFSGFDAFKLLFPTTLIPYLVPEEFQKMVRFFSEDSDWLLSRLNNWNWFNIPIGVSGIGITAFALVNYALWTGWIWRAVNRRFRNPSGTPISKQQSYWIAAFFEVLILGFSVSTESESLQYNLNVLSAFNLILFVILIAALSPHRQTCVDWARYRHVQPQQKHRNGIRDLVWGEKSPAVEAIALNLIITHAITTVWVLIAPDKIDKQTAIFTILLSASLILLYATLTQLLLLMKTPKRGIWAVTSTSSAIALPPLIFLALSVRPETVPGLWLFTVFPWEALKYAPTTIVMLSLATQWVTFVLLNVQLKRRLQKAGESASKALLAAGN